MDGVGSPPLSHDMVKIFYIFISFLEPFSLSFGAAFEIYLPRETSKIIVKASEHSVVI